MKHTYIDNLGNCAKCGRTEIEHGQDAQCEACTNKANCEVINGMLLCPECVQRELAVIEQPVAINPKAERITALRNALMKEIPTSYQEFFNNEITAIVDIEAKLSEAENPNWELANAVEQRIRGAKQNLFKAKEIIDELRTNLIVDQRYLNQLVPKLREEERAKFKDYDISYTPSAVSKPSGAPKVRVSAQDKAIADFAKMMGISIEQAKAAMNKVVTNLGVKCTCAETPGLCKLHPEKK